jgi:cyclase
MYWERVSEDIFLFTSDRYAMVNCTAVLTEEGIVIIDALPFPNEAEQIARFLEVHTEEGFHSLILTHHHMDHVYGLDAFPKELDVISSERCRELLLEVGEESLKEARRNNAMYDDIDLRIPSVTFDTGEMLVSAGSRTFRLFPLPGHTKDNIGVYIEEDEVLMAGDAVMAIPIIARGDWEQEIETLKFIKELGPDTLVQGHGEVILRGEIDVVLDRYISYLECVYEKAETALNENWRRRQINEIPLEDCGLERVPLGIASHQLHIANILSLYNRLKAERQSPSAPDDH